MRREGRMVRSRLLNERRFSAHWVYSALSSALYQLTLPCLHFSSALYQPYINPIVSHHPDMFCCNSIVQFNPAEPWQHQDMFRKKVLRNHMKRFHSPVGLVPLTCDWQIVVLSQFELPGLTGRFTTRQQNELTGLTGRTPPKVLLPGSKTRSQDFQEDFLCLLSFLASVVFNKFE